MKPQSSKRTEVRVPDRDMSGDDSQQAPGGQAPPQGSSAVSGYRAGLIREVLKESLG